jgi:AcrR family transcriptional regulator
MATAASQSRALPRGPHSLTRDEVLASQRGRMIEAMAQTVAAKGYAATTVADVVARAGVSRKTFYEHFGDREDCFLAAYDAAVDVLLGAVAERVAAGEPAQTDWRERVRAGVRAYLGALAAEPAFAQTFLVEVHAAGPRARARRAEVHRRFVEFLRAQSALARAAHPWLPDVPDAVYPAIVGGVDEVVSDWVAQGRVAQLPDLEPSLSYFQLALLAGPEIAKEALA